MRPLVRDLYKRILTVGRDYPAGQDVVRRRAKREFFERRDLREDGEIKKAIGYGRYMIREMTGVIQLRKRGAGARFLSESRARRERADPQVPHAPVAVRRGRRRFGGPARGAFSSSARRVLIRAGRFCVCVLVRAVPGDRGG